MAHEDDDFWDEMVGAPMATTASSLDLHLQRREERVGASGLRALTDAGRAASALPLPAEAGMRVAFVSNLGSVLSYANPPLPNAVGTVVLVRTAQGDCTSLEDHVFVKFDDGHFAALHCEHLRRASSNVKIATGFVRRVASLGDLTGFLRVGTDDELVHKATRDLWSFRQTPEGDYLLARLFDDTGAPLRV